MEFVEDKWLFELSQLINSFYFCDFSIFDLENVEIGFTGKHEQVIAIVYLPLNYIFFI